MTTNSAISAVPRGRFKPAMDPNAEIAAMKKAFEEILALSADL